MILLDQHVKRGVIAAIDVLKSQVVVGQFCCGGLTGSMRGCRAGHDELVGRRTGLVNDDLEHAEYRVKMSVEEENLLLDFEILILRSKKIKLLITIKRSQVSYCLISAANECEDQALSLIFIAF